jgi:hypothetical protein
VDRKADLPGVADEKRFDVGQLPPEAGRCEGMGRLGTEYLTSTQAVDWC